MWVIFLLTKNFTLCRHIHSHMHMEVFLKLQGLTSLLYLPSYWGHQFSSTQNVLFTKTSLHICTTSDYFLIERRKYAKSFITDIIKFYLKRYCMAENANRNCWYKVECILLWLYSINCTIYYICYVLINYYDKSLNAQLNLTEHSSDILSAKVLSLSRCLLVSIKPILWTLRV